MATQVGVGEVAIVPTIKGFRRTVTSEVEGTTKEAKGVFEKGFGTAGSDAGGQTGRGFHQAFSGQTKNTTADLTKAIKRDVASASREVSNARLKEQDAAGKVRVAETQLAEVRKKYASDSSQVVRAEERLQSAQRTLAERQGTTKTATERLKDSQAKLATETDRVEREMREAAKAAGMTVEEFKKAGAGANQATSEMSNAGESGAAGFLGAMKGGLLKVGGVVAAALLAANIAGSVGDIVGNAVRTGMDYVKESIGLASDLEQSVGAVEAIFKGNAATILGWSEDSAQAVGLSTAKYQEFATLVGAQLKNMGFEMGEVTTSTGDLVSLGADLAAQFGGPTSDAVAALSSLLRGERNPIERYGVTINEAAVKAKALSMGLVEVTADADKVAAAQMRAEVAQRNFNEATAKYGEDSKQALTANASLLSAQSALESAMEGTTSEITTQQKAQATLALLYEQTADSQGRFGEEFNTNAGQVQRFNAELENLQTGIGTALLPAMTDFMMMANEELLPILQETADQIGPVLGDALKEAAPSIAELAKEFALILPDVVELAAEVLPVLVEVLKLITPFLKDGAIATGEWFSEISDLVSLLTGNTSFAKFSEEADEAGRKVDLLSVITGGASGSIIGSLTDVIVIATRMGTAVGDGVNTAIGWIQSLPQRAKDSLGDLRGLLADSGRALIQGFIDGITSMVDRAGEAASSVLGWVRGFFPSSPAKRGPLSGVGWSKLKGSGSAFMEQWSDGVQDAGHRFSLPDLIRNLNEASLRHASLNGIGLTGNIATSTGLTIEAPVNVQLLERDPQRVGREIIRGVVDAVGVL